MLLFTLSVIISTVSYLFLGKIVSSYFKFEITGAIHNTIIGFITTSIVSFILNFFIPISPIINLFFIIMTATLFIACKLNISKTDILFIFLTSMSTILLLLYSTEFRPDAGLYHLPYTQIINENKIIIGLTNLDQRYGHISILQYASAINFNFIIGKYGILVPIASLAILFYFYFINEILQVVIEKQKINSNTWFSLLILIYIAYKINRFSEFGNDATAHLFVLYAISLFLKQTQISNGNLKLFYFYSVFAFLNKVFFLFIFILPLYFILKKPTLAKKLPLSLPSFIICAWLLKNILISGCLIYPMSNTCISKLNWTNIQTTKSHEILGEAWAKAWPQNKKKELTMDQFNKNFNWIDAWTEKHFKKIIKIITPYILMISLLLIIINIESSKNNKIKYDEKKINILYIFCILGLVSFFLKYPLYRYGYSYIILLIFLISCVKLKSINFQYLIKICKFILPICIVILISKQLIRIIEYKNERDIIPLYVFINDDYKKRYLKIKLSDSFSVYYKKNLCFYGKAPCTSYKNNTKDLKVSEKFGYTILHN